MMFQRFLETVFKLRRLEDEALLVRFARPEGGDANVFSRLEGS